MKSEISAEDASWKLDQIQNGPLSAIIYFHMPNILQTVLDVIPLLYNKIWGFGGGCTLSFLPIYIEFKMTVNQLLVTSIGMISGKPCRIGRPLLGYWLGSLISMEVCNLWQTV